METVFLEVLNRSIAAGWLVLVVVLLRMVFKKGPKAFRCVLWGLVGLRLILPFSLESVLSLVPSPETVSPEILYAKEPMIHSGIDAVNRVVNPVLSESLAPEPFMSANPMQILVAAAAYLWIAGMAAMVLYGVISGIRLKCRVAQAVPLRENLWQCEKVRTPFVFGFFRPRIYLPFAVEEETMAHVVAHEQAHIRRRDHWSKAAAFLLLAVYWFHPLLWAAYFLLCRDMELACDERAVRGMGTEERKAYSQALLSCSMPHRAAAVCPLAFGEVGVKARIKNVLHYKKPAFWVSAAAVVLCAVAAVCFLTDPQGESDPLSLVSEFPGDGVYTGGRLLAENLALSYQPEDGSYYKEIRLSYGRLTVVNSEGETIFEGSGSSVSQMTRRALLERLKEGLVWWFLEDGSMVESGEAGTPVPEYHSLEDMAVYFYFPEGGDPEKPSFSIYFFHGQPLWFAEGEMGRIYELLPAGEQDSVAGYVSGGILYEGRGIGNAWNPDDCRYLIGSDGSFAIIDQNTGELLAAASGVKWNWTPLKDNMALWNGCFSGPDSAPAPDISAYGKPLMLELSGRLCLLNMDGELWLMEKAESGSAQRIVRLAPEGTAAESAVWESTPLLSSRTPAFPFRFDCGSYTQIEATASEGLLIGFDDQGRTDAVGYPEGKNLTVPVGSALYWSPWDGESSAMSAQIGFTVWKEETPLYSGTIFITGEKTQEVSYVDALYTAALTGTKTLSIAQDGETGGALIFPRVETEEAD